MHCPRCGGSLPEKTGEELKCLLCGRSHKVEDWIAEEYRRGGQANAMAQGVISSTRTLYKISSVQQIRAEKILDKLSPEIRQRVLEKYNNLTENGK